jgi:hypothetical protein
MEHESLITLYRLLKSVGVTKLEYSTSWRNVVNVHNFDLHQFLLKLGFVCQYAGRHNCYKFMKGLTNLTIRPSLLGKIEDIIAITDYSDQVIELNSILLRHNAISSTPLQHTSELSVYELPSSNTEDLFADLLNSYGTPLVTAKRASDRLLKDKRLRLHHKNSTICKSALLIITPINNKLRISLSEVQ